MDYFELSEFDADTEGFVRTMCAGDGLPQDRLVWADYQFVGWCGLSCQFRWASGRQDAHIFLDLPEAEMRALHDDAWAAQMQVWLDAREQLRLKLMEKTHGRKTGKGYHGNTHDSQQAAAV